MILVHHVLDIASHDVVGFKRLVNPVNQILVLWVVKIADAEHPFCLVVAVFGERAGLIFDIDGEILVFPKRFHEAIGDLILRGSSPVATGNNERRAGFIDQNRVGFIDDGKLEAA